MSTTQVTTTTTTPAMLMAFAPDSFDDSNHKMRVKNEYSTTSLEGVFVLPERVNIATFCFKIVLL